MKKYAVIKLVAYSFAAVLLTAILVCGIVFDFGSNIFEDIRDGIVNDGGSEYSVGSEIKITDEIKEIDIEWVSGKVTFAASDDENIYILEECDGGLKSSDAMVYRINGNRLEIDFAKASFSVNVSIPGKNLIVRLPEKHFSSVTVTAVSAEVSIKNVTADDVDIESVSGDVEILDAVFNDIEIETVSGNAEIYLPVAASFRAEFDSVSGSFDTDFAVTTREDEYICGNGGCEIIADTVSGDVRILQSAE